jgi:pilus assembly protein CpaE
MANETIRVLIVDDIPETRDNLRKMLSFENDVEVVGSASSGLEAIRLAKQHQPHVVLMDINMPGVDGISASEGITQEVPFASVVMMSVQSESDYLRRSMLAGARDFLTKPFTSDELVSTIRRVYQMGPRTATATPTGTPVGTPVLVETRTAKPAQAGQVIAVFGAKGGVGCSLVAVNLAIALSNKETRVAIVDSNLQFGDVGVMLNLQASRNITDLVPQINDLDEEYLQQVMTPHESGVRALLAPPRPEMADLVHSEHLKAILARLRGLYDCIVVDTDTSLHDRILNVLDSADRIVLVGTPDIPALKNARLFLEITEALEYDAQKILFVVNKVDKRIGGISTTDIQDAIKHPVSAELPAEAAAALVSVNKGMPVVLADSKNPLAKALTGLAQQVRKGERPEDEQEHDKPRPPVAQPELRGIRGQLAKLLGLRSNGHAVASRR